MIKGKKIKIIRAPDDWEIIQQNNGYAEIDVDVLIEDNPDDDTEIELDFSLSDIYARIVNEESGEFVTPLVRLAAEEKSYRCMFRKVPCGGPYLLDFVLFNKEKCIDAPLIGARRRHFYVGDVYIIAGQSNAAGMGKGFLSEEPETGIHVLRNLQYWDIASQPFNDFDYSKQSMFMAFAKKVRKQTGMPIGLIPAAMGGAPLSRWLKDENGDLYGKLVSCLKKHKIKARAMLWYQGCADVWNTSEPSDYIGRFKKFTEAVR